MQLEKLSRFGMRYIYIKHLRSDFPADERKPCFMILRGMRRGSYVCYALRDDDGTLLAYSVVMLGENGTCLLDYLAVVRGMRGRGIGHEMMARLCGEFSARSCMFIEYEWPTRENDAASRREHFYMQAGMRRTAMDLMLYGVRYRIGAIPLSTDDNDAQLKRKLIELYRQEGYRCFAFSDAL